ncbi:GNAT family N-acetyltransferase [Catenulispora subtropica]
MTGMDVGLLAVAPVDKPVIANLLQLYLHDFSEYEPRELSPQGTFEYSWLDSYFTTPGREAYLITVADRPAGFALTRCDVDGDDGAWNVSEFFVVRGHRRQGVAAQAARLLFQRHPGPWTLSYLLANTPASRFWPKLVSAVAHGPVSHHEQRPPEVPAPRIRLRFPISAHQP